MNHVYTKPLEKIGFGRPFMMLNYTGVYIRVVGNDDYRLTVRRSMGDFTSSINDSDGSLPIVELATGRLSYMEKEKPCFLYPGESFE